MYEITRINLNLQLQILCIDYDSTPLNIICLFNIKSEVISRYISVFEAIACSNIMQIPVTNFRMVKQTCFYSGIITVLQ